MMKLTLVVCFSFFQTSVFYTKHNTLRTTQVKLWDLTRL